MALFQFVCSVAVVIVLSANGCESRAGECGKMMKDQHPKVWPWQVLIRSGHHKCTGVLVSDRWVMTSINCHYGPEQGTTVSFGGHGNQTQGNQTQGNQMQGNQMQGNQNQGNQNQGNQMQGNQMQGNQMQRNQTQGNQTRNGQATVEKVECRDYTPDGEKKKSGMCLLKLSKPVHFTDTVSPICLPSEDSMLHSDLQTYVLSGPAYPSAMKVPLVGERKCKCLHPERSKGMICSERKKHDKKDESEMDKSEMDEGDMYYSKMDESKMKGDMTGGEMMDEDMMDEDMMDDCQSGMGAMMMGVQDDIWTLMGVSTGDEICDMSETPLFFTPVSKAQDWIMWVTDRSEYSFNKIWSHGYDPDSDFRCPHACPFDDPEDCDDSVFTGGANMTPSSPFVLLGVLVLSLCFTKW